MGRGKKMTPAQKASARWEPQEELDAKGEHSADGFESKPANGDHFVISLVLIGIVSVAAIIFTTLQGGEPF